MIHNNNYAQNFSYWLFKDKIPAVKLIIIISALSFLALELFKAGGLITYLGFDPTKLLVKPWSVFTYPLIMSSMGIIGVLFTGYWMWIAGGSLERSWSTRVFTLFFFGMSAISALGLYMGWIVTGIPAPQAGLWLPLAGLVMAFAMVNPEQVMLFFFIIPMKLKYLALLNVALVFLYFARVHVILGICALVGCAFSHWYVTSLRNSSYTPSRVEEKGRVIRLYANKSLGQRFNPLKWYSNYRERKRFEDFLNK